MEKQNYMLQLGQNKTNHTTLFRGFIISLITLMIQTGYSQNQWPTAGQNLQNTRHAKNERIINPANVSSLEVNWAFTTEGDVSATPSVDANYIYFPDFAGFLYKVNRHTGELVWSNPISYYTGVTGDFARVTPAISGNLLIIGTQASRQRPATLNGAHILAINKISGELVWMTEVDDHIGAQITQSAVIQGDRIFVGVASNEEGLAINNAYPCCSFRGSVVSLLLGTGQILWKTYMTPADMDFSGCAVWGSTPVVDPKRNSLYVTTGNNYTVPQEILDCVAQGGSSNQVQACIQAVPGSSENYFNAIVALDLTTGAVKWANTVMPFDAWTAACLFGGENCPEEAGPDYDFGQGPALFKTGSGSGGHELLGAGQKSGIYWAVNPSNGSTVWSTEVGPGGEIGGLQWGSAVDGQRIYVAVSNSRYNSHLMTTGPGAGQTVNGGFWAALNAATGEVVWENAATNPPPNPPLNVENPIARNIGAVSVANGVSFAGAGDAEGTMYAFDAASGEILWSFESGGTIASGPAIVDGNVYWGSGYANLNFGTPNDKVYAFHIGEQNNLAIPGSNSVNADYEYLESMNFPNPLRHSTDIIFELENNERVQLTVYDLVGNLVKTLVDEELPEGMHRINWDASMVPPGDYIYKLSYSDHHEVKQMAVLK
jgi:polyvinyl alcohol dehydrogenase (cytochrome)